MRDQKYIHFDVLQGIDDVIVTFNTAINHSDMAFDLTRNKENIISAGFVAYTVDRDSYNDLIAIPRCYGRSDSLGVQADPETDSKILRRQMNVDD